MHRKTLESTAVSAIIAFALCLHPTDAEARDSEDGGHEPLSQERLYYLERNEVSLDGLDDRGRILDIGGGGEGVIGLVGGKDVVAIDISRRELENAPDGPLKIVMDATELGFLDSAFRTATCFFTLMYIPPGQHGKVFSEVFRVLRPGGRFLVWDMVIPPRPEGMKEDIIVLPLKIFLPGRELETGYGTRWPDNGLDLEHYTALALEAGFRTVGTRQDKDIFRLELVKPE